MGGLDQCDISSGVINKLPLIVMVFSIEYPNSLGFAVTGNPNDRRTASSLLRLFVDLRCLCARAWISHGGIVRITGDGALRVGGLLAGSVCRVGGGPWWRLLRNRASLRNRKQG